MAFGVKVLADSVAPCGKRLTTWEATYWRGIHSEVLTHGALARNSASSRAIPTEKLIQRVVDDPFVPVYVGKNQRGMVAGGELEEDGKRVTRELWLRARDEAVACAEALRVVGVHKQLANRVIEPWMWITIVVSATETDNFFGLRDHEAAEPHFQQLVREMRRARDESVPRVLAAGEWHLPMVDWDDEVDRSLSREDLVKVAVGRVARVSYLTHDGKRDPREDVRLHDDLMAKRPLHASPAEHVAQALDWPRWFRSTYGSYAEMGVDGLQDHVLRVRRASDRDVEPDADVQAAETALSQMRSGKFLGWCQYRKTFEHENIGGLKP